MFQENAVNCLKNGELTLFSDIITESTAKDLESNGKVLPNDHWINQNLHSEDDKTLLLMAIDLGKHEYVKILLQSGANPSLMNYDLKVTPLIYASKKKDLESIRLLTQFGADLNSVTLNNGQTALHLACERGFTPAVSYLLTCKGIGGADGIGK